MSSELEASDEEESREQLDETVEKFNSSISNTQTEGTVENDEEVNTESQE